MSRVPGVSALPILVVLLSGCGTMANLSVGARQGWKNAQIYGGIRRDVQSAENFVADNWTWKENFDLQQDVGVVVGVALVGIDTPLSVIADTLTLPITIPAAIWGDAGGGRGNNRPPATEPAPGAAVVPVLGPAPVPAAIPVLGPTPVPTPSPVPGPAPAPVPVRQ